MTRLQALLVVFAFWAAIFLPGLGTPELKGEEGRRILPGVTMLETGNWLVPYVGGEPYLRKPPLVNWLIATSIHVCGIRNEWSVRLPSALSVLFLGCVIVGVGSRWLGMKTSLAAALFATAHISIIEKGRLAEIEAIYVVLAGVAIVIWMAWTLREDEGPVSRWLAWGVPAIFLGLGLLMKGPLHLLFFYVVVLATPRGRREFFSLPHLLAVVIMGAIFAAWAIPYFRETAHLNAAGVWEEQMRERVGGGSFRFGDWLVNLPRGLSNFLPWIILVPILWSDWVREPWFRPVRNAVVWCYVLLLLIPGVLPRYTMPLLIPASVLLAMALREPVRPQFTRPWPSLRWIRTTDRGWSGIRIAVAGASIAAAAIIVFAFIILPRVNKTDDVRPLGRAIAAAVPLDAALYVFDPGYQPALFYIDRKLVYQNEVEKLPAEVPWMLIREKARDKFRKSWNRVEVRGDFRDKRGVHLQLISLSNRR